MARELPVFDIASNSIALQTLPGNWSKEVTEVRRNVARYTEDLTWAYTLASNTMTKTGNLKAVEIDGSVVVMQRVSSNNFFAELVHVYNSASLTPFVPGQQYLVSFYTYTTSERWFWMRKLQSGGNGHGPRRAEAGRITRHHHLVKATTTAFVDTGANPLLALGSGPNSDVTFVFQGPQSLDMWAGGFQIEPVDPTYKDGIALIGDSTMAGASGKIDSIKDFSVIDNREVSTVLAAKLNVSVFNRAVGGETLATMDSRWETDITPLASRCKYAIIQGGINDISVDRTLDQMKASVQSMVSKATNDGLIFRILNCTPTISISTVPEKEAKRLAFNQWLIDTYGGSVIDIDSVARSPWDNSLLHPAGYGDGVHYTGTMKTEIAEYIARQPVWEFEKPSKYLRVDLPTSGAYNPNLLSVVDKSGSITTGGSSQVAIAANPNRRSWFIQNTSAGDLWINDSGSAATAGSPSLKLVPGAMYSPPVNGTTSASITIIGTTTGQTFTAREFQ